MPMFSRVVIVGVGLIGGSIGLAVKKRRLAEHVVGIGRHPESLAIARRRGAIDSSTTDFELGVRMLGRSPDSADPLSSLPDLVVICTPVGTVVETARRVAACAVDRGELPLDPSYPVAFVEQPENPPNLLITDVGSTKETICAALNGSEAVPLPAGCTFIGSHPIAGSERSGPEYATDHLLEGRVTIITPVDPVDSEQVALLASFWEALGANVVRLSPAEHDRVLARTSHLPHLLAAVLAARSRPEDFPYAGTGFRGVTRLASGSPTVWGNVVATNTPMILDALRDYELGLRQLRVMIEREDAAGIEMLLETAKHHRDALEK